MTEQPPAADDADAAGLVPSRRAGRRARRRLGPSAPGAGSSGDTLTALLSGVVALQAMTEALAEDVRDIRRRVNALSGRIELLDERLGDGEATSRLRTSPAPKKKSAPRKVSGG